MSLARAVCPPHAWDAFSTGFMPSIQPQVEFKINLRCVEFERQPAYPRRMDKKTIGEQIKEALEKKGLSQTDLAERCDVSDNAVSKWIKTGNVSKANIPSVCLHTGLDAGIFLGVEDDLAVTVRLPEIRPAAGVAETLRLSIQAIAEKWGIKDARDLLDPSPEAKERVEQAIIAELHGQSDTGHTNGATKTTDIPSTTRNNYEGPGKPMWGAEDEKKAANGNSGGQGGTT